MLSINLFRVTELFLYHLKIENLWFSDAFRGYEKRAVQKQPAGVVHKKGLLKNLPKFTGKHLCQSLFFHKVAGLTSISTELIRKPIREVTPATLLKKRFWWHNCFPANFANFLRKTFLQNTSGRLLLPVA